jgi:hypothetical protein
VREGHRVRGVRQDLQGAAVSVPGEHAPGEAVSRPLGGSSPTSWPPGSLDPARVTPDRIVALHPDGSVAETKPDPPLAPDPSAESPQGVAPRRTRAEIYNERKAAAAAARGGR